MKKLGKILCFVLGALFSVLSCACSNSGSSLTLFYFNTQIYISTRSTKITEKEQRLIEETFSSLEQEFSVGEDSSIIKKFNDLSVGQSLEISERAKSVFSIANECYSLSNEKFNPTVFPLVKLWGFYPNYPVLNFSPPLDEEIADVQSEFSFDFRSVKIDEENDRIIKEADCQIDFGGLLKGYALNECADLLKSNGHGDGYISIGNSSVYILGVETLGVKHPRTDGNIITVDLLGQSDLAVSTSGDYQKTYSKDGLTYSHLIDCLSGKPAQTGIASATLLSDTLSGGTLDGLTTALCLCSHSMGAQDTELTALIDKILALDEECQFYIVFLSGEDKYILTNQKQGENFTLLDSSYSVVNL